MDEQKKLNNFLPLIPASLHATCLQNKLPKFEEDAINITYEHIQQRLAALVFPIYLIKDDHRSINISSRGWSLIVERLQEAGYHCEQSKSNQLTITFAKNTKAQKDCHVLPPAYVEK